MPALSPTMTQGNIGAWQKSVGDALAPGEVLVEIETDKAQMDFEFQDDGYLAKILLDAGAKDIAVGTPLVSTSRTRPTWLPSRTSPLTTPEESPSLPRPRSRRKRRNTRPRRPRRPRRRPRLPRRLLLPPPLLSPLPLLPPLPLFSNLCFSHGQDHCSGEGHQA